MNRCLTSPGARARRSGLQSMAERIGWGAMNIRTIVLVILGMVLVSAMVLSTTALTSVVILGDFHWKKVALGVGLWLLVLGGIATTMYRRGVKTRTPGGHHP